MKKIVLLFATLIPALSMYAQDVIVTTDAQKIMAQILEVSPTEIKYKETDNPDGPVFVMPVGSINSIIYANGQVKLYNEKPNEEKQTANSLVTRSGNTYYYNGSVMGERAYGKFLKKNCPEAYKKFKTGQNISTVGWVFLFTGLGMDLCTCIGGIDAYIREQQVLEYHPNAKPNNNPGNKTAIIALASVAFAFEIACIPTLCVGYFKKHNTVDIYNNACAVQKAPQAYWSVNASQNGIGLAYHF